jgi:NTE family protein
VTDPDLASFLRTVPVLKGLDPDDLAALAGACEMRSYPDRALVLQQGQTSATLFLLKSGTVAVRVNRGGRRETVAELLPPAVFGELSFLTGRAPSADVEAIGPIEVATLPSERLATLGGARDALLQLLLTVVASRLHDTVTGTTTVRRPRCVWIRTDGAFKAGEAFALELSAELCERSLGETLIIGERVGGGAEPARSTSGPCHVVSTPSDAQLPERLDAWKRQFRYTVVLEHGHRSSLDGARRLVDATGDLVAGGPPLPAIEAPMRFLGADAAHGSIDVLSGARQLLFDVEEAARAHADGRVLPLRFRRTARSLARAIAGQQVGIAFGGGGACCWAHIGLIDTLAKADIPVDMVAGCSMGSFIGALVGDGRTVEDLAAVAEYWRTRYRRMIEWRFWRMHLISERGLRKVLAGHFGERKMNTLEIPFWANAVDITRGQEVVINHGRVSDTIRASMALPGSSPPFDMGDRVLVDAAVMAPVPVGPVRAMGADFVIAMNVMPSMEAGRIPPRNPQRFLEVLFRALRVSGQEIGRNRAAGEADVMLTPELASYSLLDFGHSREIIEAGRGVAERQRHQIVAAYQRVRDATN